MTDVNLFKFLAQFGKNNITENIEAMDSQYHIGEADGVLIKAEFARGVKAKWGLIKVNEWNGECSKASDLINEWWAKMDINSSALRNDRDTKFKEYETLSNKDLGALQGEADINEFDFEEARKDVVDENVLELREACKRKIKSFMENPEYKIILQNKFGDVYSHIDTLKNQAEFDEFWAIVEEAIQTYRDNVARQEALEYIDGILELDTNYEEIVKSFFGDNYKDAINKMSSADIAPKLSELKSLIELKELKKYQEQVITTIAGYLDTNKEVYEPLVKKYFSENYVNTIKALDRETIETKFNALKEEAAELLKEAEEIQNGYQDDGIKLPESPTIYYNRGAQYVELPDSSNNDKSVGSYKLTVNSAPAGVNVDVNGNQLVVTGAKAAGTIEVKIKGYAEDGKLIGKPQVMTIKIEEEVITSKDFAVEDNTDYSGLSFKVGETTTFDLNTSVTKNGKPIDLNYYTLTYSTDTPGVTVSSNGKVTVTPAQGGAKTIEIKVMLNGVEIHTIKRNITLQKSPEEAATDASASLDKYLASGITQLVLGQKTIHTEFIILKDNSIVFQEDSTNTIYKKLQNDIDKEIGFELNSLGIETKDILLVAWLMTYNTFNSSTSHNTFDFVTKVIQNIKQIIEKVKDNPKYLDLLTKHTSYADKALTDDLQNYSENPLIKNYGKAYKKSNPSLLGNDYNQTMGQLLEKLKLKYKDVVDGSTVAALFEQAKKDALSICCNNVNDCPYGTANGYGSSSVYDNPESWDWYKKDNRAGDGYDIMLVELVQLTLYCFDKLLYTKIFG